MLSPLNEVRRFSSKRDAKSAKQNSYGSSIAEASAESNHDDAAEGLVSLTHQQIDKKFDPTESLGPLTDSTSSYSSITTVCFHLNQFAGESTNNDSSSTTSSEIIHDATYANTISAILSALTDCVKNHSDRRCRILACKTLAQVSRNAYARLRHSNLLISIRDPNLNRVEDEAGTDSSVTLTNAALEDADEGVSACAVDALGMLCLSAVSNPVEQDDLVQEVAHMTKCIPSPYAPSLADLSDEDISVPQLELQYRVYENVIAPKLFRLVSRVKCYDSSRDTAKALPFVTASLIHLLRRNPSITCRVDRHQYAKRWMEFDVAGLAFELVHTILLPAMQISLDRNFAYTAAINGIRLAHQCPNAPWMSEVCQWATDTLVQHLASTQLEQDTSNTTAALLIALRAIKLSERVPYLEFVMESVQNLSATIKVPQSVWTSGLLTQTKSGQTCYKRPFRIGLVAEIALSLFLDGPMDCYPRTALRSFLSSKAVTSVLSPRILKRSKSKRRNAPEEAPKRMEQASLLDEDEDSIRLREELVYCLCTVASKVGSCVMIPVGKRHEQSELDQLEEWLRSSLNLLSTFSSCLGWKSHVVEKNVSGRSVDAQLSVNFAAKIAYLRLLQECLYTCGLIAPMSSVSFNVVPRAASATSPFLQDFAAVPSSLLRFAPQTSFDFALKQLITLADQFLEYKIREGIPSRPVRILLFALLTDHWMQQIYAATKSKTMNATLNELNAREILSNLSTEIAAIQSIVKSGQEAGERIDSDLSQLLRVCVACVENIALTSCEWKRRHTKRNNSRDLSPLAAHSFNQDIEDDTDYLVSAAKSALRGKPVREEGDDSEPPELHGSDMLPECAAADERVQTAFENNSSSADDASWGLTGEATLFSILVMDPELNQWSNSSSRMHRPDFDIEYVLREDKEDPVAFGDAYEGAFLAQQCRQMVLARIDMAFLSSPLASRFIGHDRHDTSSIRIRPLNWLRLRPSPLPSSRFVQKFDPVGKRLCWSSSALAVSSCSDPVSLVVAHTVRRYPRHDGETDMKLTVAMRLYNITPVEIRNGLYMDLKTSSSNPDHPQFSSFGDTGSEIELSGFEVDLFPPATAVYKAPLKGADYLTWEVTVNDLPARGRIKLMPSVTFRDMEVEKNATLWLTDPEDDSDDEDETASTRHDDEMDELMDVQLELNPLVLSPLIVLQPCPLVFYRDGLGDALSFCFLWHNMPHRAPTRTLHAPDASENAIGESIDEVGRAVALLSYMKNLTANANGWAFMSLMGSRVLCIILHDDTPARAPERLFVRSDNENLLHTLYGTPAARADFISALTSGLLCCDELHEV